MNTNQKRTLSADVLRALHSSTESATRIALDDLCTLLGVDAAPAREGVRPRALRREDVREIVRQLDEEGFVDAARMRLTLQGFTLAASLTARRLLPLSLVGAA
jgi:hypothetical protein